MPRKGESVLNSRRLNIEVLSLHKPIFLQCSEVLSEHFLRNVGDISQQLRSTHLRLGKQAKQDR